MTMIDVKPNTLVNKVYRFVLYFDVRNCLPNMGSDGKLNLLSDERYFMSAPCIKYKIKKYLHYMGRPVLHLDDGLTVFERLKRDIPDIDILLKDQKTAKLKAAKKEASKSDKESYKEITKRINDAFYMKALEYIDVRLFGIFDCADFLTLRAPKSGAVSIAHATTLDSVEIVTGRGGRSYDIMHSEDGANIGSSFCNPYQFVEYGMFKLTGGVNLMHVREFGLTEQDLDDFFVALMHMFDYDSSTFRPMGSIQNKNLVIYEWDSNINHDVNHILRSIQDQELMTLRVDCGEPRSGNDYLFTRPVHNDNDGLKIYIY